MTLETCMTIDGISFLVHCSILRQCFHDIQSLILAFEAVVWYSLRVRSQQLVREDSSVIYLQVLLSGDGQPKRGSHQLEEINGKAIALLVPDICSLWMRVPCFPVMFMWVIRDGCDVAKTRARMASTPPAVQLIYSITQKNHKRITKEQKEDTPGGARTHNLWIT